MCCPKLLVQMFNFLILISYWSLRYYRHESVIVSFICVSITNISSFQAHEVVQTTETPKIEPDKKSDLATSVAPELPRVPKPKQKISAVLKAEPTKKQESALAKHETSPVLLEVKKAELTPASRKLVEDPLAIESTPVSPLIQKPDSRTETVFIEGPTAVLLEAPKAAQELTQSLRELTLAKPEPIQEKEQTPVPKQKSPPKRGIIFIKKLTHILCTSVHPQTPSKFISIFSGYY